MSKYLMCKAKQFNIVLTLLLVLFTKQSIGQSMSGSQASHVQLAEAQIISAIEKYVAALEGAEPWQIQIECGRLPKPLPMIKTNVPLRITCQKRHPLRGRILFTVSYQNAQGKWKKLPITCMVRRFANVLISTRRLDREHVIKGDELRFVKSEITNSRQRIYTDINSVLGRQTRRIVSAGTILTSSMIKIIPVIQRGDNVTALIRKKNLMISFPAKANQEGQIGDEIIVRDLASNRLVKAKVLNQGTVIVIM